MPVTAAKRCVRLFWRVFFRRMPLEEFADYEEYWRKRQDLPILYRHRYVAADLPDKGRVLDLGCGDGTFLKYLHERKPGLDLMGIDMSETAVARLKEVGIPGQVGDVVKDGLPCDVAPDYVVIMEMLEHVPDAEAVMRRVRATGCRRCYVTIPNLGHIEHRLRLGLGGKMPITVIIFHIREHVRFWTVSDFKYWARCQGFKVVKCRGQGGTLFLWRFWPSLFAHQMIYVLESDDRSVVG